MTRKEILVKAIEAITQEKPDAYGRPEDNFQQIADLWMPYLKSKCVGGDVSIGPEDVAIMMVLFKVARMATGKPGYADNYIDIAGYAACAGEIATKLPHDEYSWDGEHE